MSNRELGKCKLCRRDRILCFSHIVPESCYRSCYDEKHRSGQVWATAKGMEIRTAQKGYREYLLCEECEQTLCSSERVFAEEWYAKFTTGTPVAKPVVVVTGMDYRAAKLTHLSVLWRFHVAKNFGRDVDLGPYAEIIREMLLRGDPGGEEFLPVLGRLMVDHHGLIMDKLVSEPQKARVDNSYVYATQYAGAEWFCLMSQLLEGKLRDVLEPFILRRSGTTHFMAGHCEGSLAWEAMVNEMWAWKRSSNA